MSVFQPGDPTPWSDLRQPYFAHAAISPPSLAARRAIVKSLDDLGASGAGGFGALLASRDATKALFARLIGASGGAAEVALVDSTSRGVATVAWGIDWRPGDRVLTVEGEFPANVTPWQLATAAAGAEVRRLPLAPWLADDLDEALSRLEAELRQGARLVAVSAVQFSTGLRMPMPAIAALARRYGAQVAVDGIQACGVTPVEVDAWGVDFLAAGGHKWMQGLLGSGFLWARAEHWGTLRPVQASWLSQEQGARFLFEPGQLRADRPLVAGPAIAEPGGFPAQAVVALEVSLAGLLGAGVPAIYDHVRRLSDILEEALLRRGFESARCRDPERRSGILAVRPPPPWTVAGLAKALGERGVSVSTPDGWLRFAPHVGNTVQHAHAAIDAVDAALREATPA